MTQSDRIPTGTLTTSVAPIIVAAMIGHADFDWLDALRRAHFPADRNQLPAHLMLFHHLPPSLFDELDRRLKRLVAAARDLDASIGPVMPLGRGVALRVRSPALEKIREDLADSFAGSLTPQDRNGWRPHITLQNKTSPEVARDLAARLAPSFERPRALSLLGIATFFYRGGPWEAIKTYRVGR